LLKLKLTLISIEYVYGEPAIGIRVLDNGIFAGHDVCPTV